MSQDEYNEAWEVGYKAATKKYRDVLMDVAVMFEDIERNRAMPPFAQTQQQYVAMGRVIKKLLATDM
jgi:hypothetical protein